MVKSWHKDRYSFEDLVEIMKMLRAPDGCPWDREQTHESIRRNFIEETYEVCEAIDEKNASHLCEELGDVMLQVVFHAQLEEEQGTFDINDVTTGVCRKLILRHPHVFGTVHADTSEQVLKNWEEIKKTEKSLKTYSDEIDAVAKTLPSLIRAEKIQKKAAKAGFDWPDAEGAYAKILEEKDELRAAAGAGGDVEDELGDLLFACVNVARFLKVDPEGALERACNKFSDRFRRMEERILAEGKDLKEMSLEEMDAVWEQVKKQV